MVYALLLVVIICSYCTSASSFVFHKIQHVTSGTSCSLSRLYGANKNVKFSYNRDKDIKGKRSNELVKSHLNFIIHSNQVKTPTKPDKMLLLLTNVYAVTLAHDRSHAKVDVTCAGNSVQKRQIYVWLCTNVKAIRQSLCAYVGDWRRVPTLSFNLVDPMQNFLAERTYKIQEEKIEKDDSMRMFQRLSKLQAKAKSMQSEELGDSYRRTHKRLSGVDESEEEDMVDELVGGDGDELVDEYDDEYDNEENDDSDEEEENDEYSDEDNDAYSDTKGEYGGVEEEEGDDDDEYQGEKSYEKEVDDSKSRGSKLQRSSFFKSIQKKPPPAHDDNDNDSYGDT